MRKKTRLLNILLTAGLIVCAAAAGCGNQAEAQTSQDKGTEAIYISNPSEDTQKVKNNGTEGSTEAAQSQKESKFAQPEFEDADDTVYVTTDQVNIRTSCDADSKTNIFQVAMTGDSFKRTGKNSEWTRLETHGMTVYVATRYVSQEPVEKPRTATPSSAQTGGAIGLDSSWKYAQFSKINSGTAMLYRSQAANRKDITVCVNAGHGTKGGSSVKTQCHPDGTPKVTGGTTGAGATSAVAVSSGMTFADGTPEHKVTLALAKVLKEQLLAEGYDVLMIRESEDVQLDNVARTVIANNASDCHIALHWDSTSSNKGAFYMAVPSAASYRNMEPVKSHWMQHNALGESLIAGLKSAGVKIFSGGSMEMDLTQTSYSTVPSMDIELGDKASDHSQASLEQLAKGLTAGVNLYFENNR